MITKTAQCRAIGCGFILAESRGPVGRFFRDMGETSRSLREALLDPRFSIELDDTTSIRIRPPGQGRRGDDTRTDAWSADVQARAEAMTVQRDGICRRRRAERERAWGRDAMATTPASGSSDRRQQLHTCLQSLHVFQQEHGHLPLAFGRDHAEEVVRIAEELVQAELNVSRQVYGRRGSTRERLRQCADGVK